MAGRLIHVCLNVRCALLNWSNREFRHMVRNGQPLSPREARAALLNELARGHEVIPIGPACEGFDYSGGGCPGHDIDEERPVIAQTDPRPSSPAEARL